MGIFSLFGKKDGQAPSQADRDAARKKRSEQPAQTIVRPHAAPPAQSQLKRKASAEETALKIDAIESEMSSEFVKYGPATKASPPAPPVPRKPTAAISPDAGRAKSPSATPLVVENTAAPTTTRIGGPTMASTTQLLMSETYSAAALSVSEAIPVIEEAAILYANGQTRVAEQMLQQAIDDNQLGDAAMLVWNMLFDLYLVTGKREEFENLSIAFANKFETSPPAWVELEDARPKPAAGTAVPVVPFPPKLDAGITKQLERVQNLAANHRTLRLEFARVAEVNPVGCGILLNVLTRLQKSGNDLVLVGSHELAEKIRGIIQVGRRDETEAPWLLLLEILRLLNLEKDFEETSIDYCVTFEVSPPAFVAPQNKVTTASEEASPKEESGDHFAMPRVVEGNVDTLIAAIAAHAEQHKPAIIDCSRMLRVDFGAAGHLLTGLAPLTLKGMTLEFHNVNHLVAALFRVIGLNDLVRIVPRKA